MEKGIQIAALVDGAVHVAMAWCSAVYLSLCRKMSEFRL